ncbi:MAG: 2Fe-2S iron-sulfur cluster-binding protein, partial [Bauldia sp.]|nr:2Fe-2S iron-sulfur cluster-binding protein [Bauldia sp.]
MTDRLIVFTPSGKRGRVAEGISVLDAARALGVDLDSVCAGRGICGRCQIDVAEGEFQKHGIASRAANLSPWNGVEQRYADVRGPLHPGRRLGCQAHVLADVVVDVPAESQVHRQVIRKAADLRPIRLDPVVHLHYVE